MSTARDYLDAGFDALGLLGGPADLNAAREQFRRAVGMDAGMCDAWLGLIATGDHASETLRHAHETSATVHRETRRLGLQDTALEASVPSPGFIEVFPYTAATITLAFIAALLSEGDHDTAEKLLESFDTDREPLQTPIWRCLGVTLHYITQRWTDVLDWAARPVSGTLRVVDAATDLMAGVAHVHLGEVEAGLVLLRAVPTDQVSAQAGALAALYRGYALRRLGREDDARAEFGMATVNGRMLADAAAALADATYAPAITTAEAIAARTTRWDPQSGPTLDELREAEQAKAAQAVLEESERDLQAFIGLGAVKAHINKLKRGLVYDRRLAARGEAVGERNALHMTLVGPPGTAKTSIARVMGKMYFGLGILKSPKFIEVSRKDLVGGHIGETEIKTGAILDRARGRVLFVDEAPELYKADNERDFGRIALDVLMKFAEDHRDDTLIALAGYAGGMNRLLSANPGLRSRFPNKLEFTSYSANELGQIAALFAESYRVLVHPEAVAAFSRYTQWLTATSTANPDDPTETLIDIAGNGRYVRNVMSEAVELMKARVVTDPSIDMATADLDVLRTVTSGDMIGAVTAILASAGIQTQ
ncbi:AAA+ family ATPase (plasmid) [Mycolicibacterium chubuense NBB4]|uniref:AAA+ family ATPase n=1 Tax=Mycolicibacterium chubuense (strain NBB4) TaxID=710421 RepID=I4BTL0_MYCCN|nr:AAA+ family ATPase [Mycolicibacterium chubuense NBB4]